MSGDCNYCSYQFNVQDEKTPAKCALSHGRPCLACERQVKLHRRIEETKKLLDELIIEEREARTDINAHHDPLQARRLPVEITSYIFRLTLPPFTLQKPSYHNSYPTEEIYCSREALVLGAVCGAWRQTAWSTPQLWTNIMLTLHREPTPNKMAVVEEWLERSKTLDLNIRLFLVDVHEFTEKRYEDLDPELFIQRCSLQDFVSLFNKHSARWSTLSIQAPSEISKCFTGNGSEDGAPRLQDIQLLNFQTRSFQRRRTGNFQLEGEMPSPGRIEAAGYPGLNNIAISWWSVTHATLDVISLDEYIALLQDEPELVKLSLKGLTIPEDLKNPGDPIALTPPIQHDNLQILAITVGYEYKYTQATTVYSVIFESFTLPSLKDLTFEGPQSDSFTVIQQFLERSSPQLKGLELRMECDQQEVLDLLYSLPSSMKFLKLDVQTSNREDFNLDTLFDHLTCAPNVTKGMAPRPDLLPNLVTFEWFLDGRTPYPIPWARLPHLRYPLSGKPERPLEDIGFFLRYNSDQDDPLFFLDKRFPNIDESAVRGLIGLVVEDGMDIYLPRKVSRHDLEAVLEE